MPKMKTKKAARKRFKFTASGKINRKRSFLRHILTSKNRKRKRGLRKSAIVHRFDEIQVRRMMPYG